MPRDKIDAPEVYIGHQVGQIKGAEASPAPDLQHVSGVRACDFPKDVRWLEGKAAVRTNWVAHVQLRVQARPFEPFQQLVIPISRVLIVREHIIVGERGMNNALHVVCASDASQVLYSTSFKT